MADTDYQAKIGTGRDENRTPLWQVVPIPVPFSVGITVSDFCNFKCLYCNHSIPNAIKNPKMMTYDMFREIAAQLEEFYRVRGTGRTKNLRMWGYGEPLMNKDLPRMISCARERELSDRVEITTNASLLTHEISDALIDAGLTRMIVSVQGVTEAKYKDTCGYRIDYPRLLNELSYFYAHRKTCKVFIKTVDVALDNAEEHEQFYKMFGPVCDEMGIEHIFAAFEGVDYASFMPKSDGTTRYKYEYKEKLVCDTLFSLMNIQTNGNVDCCGCKYPPLPIGNIHRTRLKDIWNGEIHRKYMELHLTGHYRDIPACDGCESMQFNGHPMDILDDHREELLPRVRGLGKDTP